MADLTALIRDPTQAAALSPDERQRIMQQCALLILALSAVPIPAKEQEAERAPTADVYLTIEEAATRIRRAPNTLYHWIQRGTLKEETGLRRVQGQPLIEWAVFEQCFVHGLAHPR